MSTSATRHASPAGPLTAAVGAVGVLAIVAQVALHTEAGQRLDERARTTMVAGREAKVAVLGLLGQVSIGAVLAVAATCVALAVIRRRWRLAAGALVVIAGADLSTQLLKRVVLDRSVLDVVAPNSLPSGHATAVASAVGALLLVAPRAARLLVVVLGSFAIGVTGASTIVAGWHRPADVVAALAVCVAWTAAGAMVAGGTHHPVPGVTTGALGGAAAALILLVAIGVRPSYGWSGFGDAAFVLGAMAAATALAVALMDRISPTGPQP